MSWASFTALVYFCSGFVVVVKRRCNACEELDRGCERERFICPLCAPRGWSCKIICGVCVRADSSQQHMTF